MKFLIIEDDPNTAETVRYCFTFQWTDTAIEWSFAYKGEEGLKLVKTHSPDIILLDLGLPDIDGLDVLKQIRSFSKVPVIILTVRDRESERVAALDLGADDYVAKPFSPSDLLSRVRAVLRRRQMPELQVSESKPELQVSESRLDTINNPPDILYHYTNQDGLLGILEEKALWATKIQFMNDASELKAPLEIATKSLETLVDQKDNEWAADGEKRAMVISRMRDDIEAWADVNICLIPFCTSGDLLSQWRAYRTNGSAYAFGFDSLKLLETIANYPFTLIQCEYLEEEEYQRRIEEFVKDVISRALIKNHPPGDFIETFVNTASEMKLSCFKEEDEWRLVSWRPLNSNDDRFRFRHGKSVVIPYYSLPLDLSSIVEIIVGPSPNPELAKDAVEGLASKYDLAAVRSKGGVKLSKITYSSL